MNRQTLMRVGTLSLMLGVSTVACTTGAGHVASLADQTPKAKEVAAKTATRARSALASHHGASAVDMAERVVALDPDNGAYRMLLGQSYLALGRFASAETSFRDSLSINADQPKARFDMALAQIAQGRAGEAQATLRGLQGAIPASDLGLALALSGDRQAAIAMLVDVVRSGQSDARARQNLALAFALNGQWREARGVAMQDTPGDRIEGQLAHWAELAKPDAGGTTQVAAMLGVIPANDPGLPTALALAKPADTGAAPVALAAADPVPAVVPQADPHTVTVPLDDAVAVAAPADAPAAEAVHAAQTVAHLEAAPVPALLRAAPPPLLRAPAAPFRRAALIVAPRAAFRSSGYVVQLGAFSRAGAIQAAWGQASRAMPRLAGYAPVRAEFSFSGSSLVRLSVSGFADRESAVALCSQLRAKGSPCFVRATAGDAPLQWAKRDEGTRVAMRDRGTQIASR